MTSPRTLCRTRPGNVAVAAALVALVGACSSGRQPTAPAPMPQPMTDSPSPGPGPAPEPVPAPAPATARYRVTFDATWSRTTHPQDPPDDPHFSPLIGGTHNATVTFWHPGALASPGIQRMAEAGARSPLSTEIEAAIAAGQAEFVITRDGQFDSPDRVTIEFTVSQQFPLVTLVTMVAPSPDWFVGVGGLPLFENGAWRDDVQLELFAYDAGTDSGASFMSPDEETRPHVPIARISGFPFLVGSQVPSLGTFTFTRLPG